ncbi:MAG: hypothetical protein HZA16_09355 [Nitrospirae bacterium]|nr:hypothetical protein [Nitrospirota bacterium]
MKRVFTFLFVLAMVLGFSIQAHADTPVTFTFETAGTGPDLIWGSQETEPLKQNGFIIDVIDSDDDDHYGAHFHETNSISNPKVPDRPSEQRGVLWHDAPTQNNPLFFIPEDQDTIFSLQSLVVGASTADGSQTTGVQFTAFRDGNLLATSILPTVTNGYISYSGSTLGLLDGLYMDRLEVIGLSNSSVSYYMLDDVAINTAVAPEPVSMVLFGVGGVVLAARRMVSKRR